MKRHGIYLGLIWVLLLMTACGSTTTPALPPTATLPVAAPVLELQGPAGNLTFSLAELQALPAVEGWGGFKSSTGEITLPARYKGVSLQSLIDLIGGMDEQSGLSIVAKDGYAMTMSYAQAFQGDFIAYDPATGDETTPDTPLKVILAYESEGTPLPETSDGTLRIMVISDKNDQVVDGHWTVKWVNRIEIKSLALEWDLHLEGVLTETMDRGTFESCAAASCHGVTWTDDKAQEWNGVPLYRLMGRIDDEQKHDDLAFNRALAEQGYTISITADDGYTVQLDSTRVTGNRQILVAHAVNGNPLDEQNFPLRLVGADLKPNERIGRIREIVLNLPDSISTPTAITETATPATETISSAVTLTLRGAVQQERVFSWTDLHALKVVQLTLEHPKKGAMAFEGVRITDLLAAVTLNAEAKELLLVADDGFTALVALSDVQKCADCLLTFQPDGTLMAAMPGMESNVWAKNVVAIEFR